MSRFAQSAPPARRWLVTLITIGLALVGLSAPEVASAAPTTLASDDFSRTVTGGWGPADIGGGWSITSPSNSSVAGGVGNLTMSAPGSGPAAYLNAVSVTDADVVVQLSLDRLPVGGTSGADLSLIARRVGTQDYRGKIRVLSTGAVRVGIARTASTGVQTLLSGETTVAGLTYAVGDSLVVRVRATGTAPTQLNVKAWKLGTTEPATWQLTTSDTTAALQAAGGVGFHAYLSSAVTNAPVKVSYDALRVVTTTAPANQSPTAAFTTSTPSLVASFDGSASSDPEGPIASYSWNFGDGTGAASGATPYHSYAAAGSYQVTLKVTDGQGAVGSVTKAIKVTAPGLVPRPDHVVVVVMENHSAGSILGNSSAPYINSLATAGANMTQSFAPAHPSEPNYLALFSGSVQGLTDDSCPHTYATTNLADQLAAKGLTFTGYSEDLPSVGFTGCFGGSLYARKHNPWVNFPSVPASANQPMTAFPTDYTKLPTLSFVVPNLQNDMHDGSIAQGDAWLQTRLGAYVTWAKTHNSLLVLTWDEDDYSANNHIATIFSGERVKTGQYPQAINHYNVLRTLQDGLGLANNDGSAAATPITNIWGSVAPPNQSPTASFTSSAVNLVASFDGSASSDPDGSIASYSWNFGDGTAAGTGVRPSHTYAAAGTYQVTLTVTDNQGATNAVTHPITVSAAPNQAPTAAFTSSAVNLVASFNGSASSDPYGSIASYSWNFGDATPAGTGATPSHTYAAAGTYQVTLTVTDNQGATNAVTHPVTVTSGGAVVRLASDDFGRSLSGSWGAADLGGTWSVTSPTNSAVGGVGRLVMAAAGTGPAAYLSGMSTSDADVQVQLGLDRLPLGGTSGADLSLIARRVGTEDYRGKARILSTGAVRVSIARVASNGAQTSLTGETTVAGLTYAVGDQLVVRVQATGTAPTLLKVKVWKLGTTEPATWALTSSDTTATLQTAGTAGIHAYLSSAVTNAPVTASYDSFRVWAASTE